MPSVDDVVAAARALRRAPRFSALSIAVLALGIAANVILFAVGSSNWTWLPLRCRRTARRAPIRRSRSALSDRFARRPA